MSLEARVARLEKATNAEPRAWWEAIPDEMAEPPWEFFMSNLVDQLRQEDGKPPLAWGESHRLPKPEAINRWLVRRGERPVPLAEVQESENPGGHYVTSAHWRPIAALAIAAYEMMKEAAP